MRLYVDDNDNIRIVQSVADASNMVSSVTGCIKRFILKSFPKDLFKKIYIDTSETFIQKNMNNLYDNTLDKIPYPSLSITPEITIDDPIGGMSKNPRASSPMTYLVKDLRRTYSKLLSDPDQKFNVYFSTDYITTNFNVKIYLNSYIQNIDMGLHLKSLFDFGFFNYLEDQMIETEFPKTFIKIISALKGLEITDNADMDLLREYLISISRRAGAVLKKVSLSTGKTCFFFGDKQNLVTLFSDLDVPSSVVRNNKSEGEYVINFRVQVSCHLPNAYIMSIDKKKFKTIYDDVKLRNEILDNKVQQQDAGTFTMATIPVGQSYYREMKYFKFHPNSEEDIIGQNLFYEVFQSSGIEPITKLNLIPMLPEKFLKVHAYYNSYGDMGKGNSNIQLDLRELMEIDVHVDPELYNSKDIIVNNEDLTITFNKPIDSDFAVSMFVNRNAMELAEKDMKTNNFFFKSNALMFVRIGAEIDSNFDWDDVTNTDPNPIVVEKFVKVYQFMNEEEMNSNDVRKSFRIMTQYGPGYFGLVNEGDPVASPFKICIGYDKYGHAIIKCLELYEEI